MVTDFEIITSIRLGMKGILRIYELGELADDDFSSNVLSKLASVGLTLERPCEHIWASVLESLSPSQIETVKEYCDANVDINFDPPTEVFLVARDDPRRDGIERKLLSIYPELSRLVGRATEKARQSQDA